MVQIMGWLGMVLRWSDLGIQVVQTMECDQIGPDHATKVLK